MGSAPHEGVRCRPVTCDPYRLGFRDNVECMRTYVVVERLAAPYRSGFMLYDLGFCVQEKLQKSGRHH